MSSYSEVVIFFAKNNKLTHASKRLPFTKLYISKFGIGNLGAYRFQLEEDEKEAYGVPSMHWCSTYLNK